MTLAGSRVFEGSALDGAFVFPAGGTTPGDPSGVTSTPTGGTTGTTTWTAGSPVGSGYEVQIESPSGAGNWTAASGTRTGTSFAHTGLTPYASYRTRVRATDGGLFSGWVSGAEWFADNTGTGGGVVGVYVEAAATGAHAATFSASVSTVVPANVTVAGIGAHAADFAATVDVALGVAVSMAATGAHDATFSADVEVSDSVQVSVSAVGEHGATFSASVTVRAQNVRDPGVLAARQLQRRKTLRATTSREVNLMWRRKEPADEREPFYREQVPGLSTFATIGGGEYRGGWSTVSRAFVVFGSGFYEITPAGGFTQLGTLATNAGPVDMVQGVGLLVIVDGPNGYTFALASDTFAQITDSNFLGSRRVGYLDGRFVFAQPDSQLFYWTKNIDDGSAFDALDFASAESAPDLIVGHVVDHREIWFMGERTGEPWVSAPTADGVPYQRNSGAILETGLAATHSLQRLDNSIYWVSRDANGEGMVMVSGGAGGYQPIRISDHSIEEALVKATDLADCYAFTYQDSGQSFYCLQIPGWETTWVYDVSVKRWHERAELENGQLAPWRISGMLFAFGKHLAGGTDGVMYELDDYEYTYAGDVLYRNFVTPHTVTPGLNYVYFSKVELLMTAGDTSSGERPSVEMRYSNDGGKTWGDWMRRSAGEIGEYNTRPRWLRLGRARDRVWEFRITDDCKAAIVTLSVDATEGAV